ncbi:MAG: hypothetical protein A2010_17390 [Nitrospirae bacterium GWD2_57_9]|nr:MAG: hypothetical protein A2010_17390 [Nitrospirae bacterium GWD2_57_9]OGW47139.1 MAG: hypothetical protein A2078_12400 [Nitrospirae bacterium GWC2_57_9]
MIHIVLILIVAGTVLTFSAQNEIPTTVSFLVWQFELSPGLAAAVAMLAGIVLMQLLASLRSKQQAGSRRSLESLSRRYRW